MIYREIPKTSSCKDGCHACCGPVPWSREELAAVQGDLPSVYESVQIGEKVALQNPLTGMCVFLGKAGCTVYERRPFMCRIFGASQEEMLVCPHGVAAERALSVAATHTLTKNYIAMERA